MRTAASCPLRRFCHLVGRHTLFRFCYRDRIIHIGVGKRVTLTLESGPSLGIICISSHVF